MRTTRFWKLVERLWSTKRRGRQLKISSPLPLPTESDDSYEPDKNFNNEPLRHSFGPGFQVMSDLHLEGRDAGSEKSYERFTIPRQAPYLVLIGDIGYFRHAERYQTFLRRQCDVFDHVFLIPGNHEFYGVSRARGLQLASDMAKSLGGRLTVMDGDQRRVNIDESTILIGCTLYSAGEPDRGYYINDFHCVSDWSPQQHVMAHNADKDYLERALKDIKDKRPNSRVLIATHYAPLYGPALHPRHRNSPLNSFFCSDILDDLMRLGLMGQVDVWISGHTHYNMNDKVGHVQVASNQFSDKDSRRKFSVEATV